MLPKWFKMALKSMKEPVEDVTTVFMSKLIQ